MNKITVELLKNYITEEIERRGLEEGQIYIDFTGLFDDISELEEASRELGYKVEKAENIGFGVYWIYIEEE